MFIEKFAAFRKPGPRRRELPIELIAAPENVFAPEDEPLQAALAVSVSRHGVLHPLLVRKNGRGYDLIAGSRRLAAAKAAGLKKVPCLMTNASPEELCSMRLSENLHRHEPDFLETAESLRALITRHSFSIEDAAALSGLSLQEVTEKLRILKLPTRLLFAIRDSGLTERHALALLRITSDELRESALCEMAYNDMGPEAAERYVDKLLKIHTPEEVPGQRPIYIVKDVRMFLNSVSHGMDMMRGGGIDAECIREDADNCIKLTIRIPERRG